MDIIICIAEIVVIVFKKVIVVHLIEFYGIDIIGILLLLFCYIDFIQVISFVLSSVILLLISLLLF